MGHLKPKFKPFNFPEEKKEKQITNYIYNVCVREREREIEEELKTLNGKEWESEESMRAASYDVR